MGEAWPGWAYGVGMVEEGVRLFFTIAAHFCHPCIGPSMLPPTLPSVVFVVGVGLTPVLLRTLVAACLHTAAR